MDTRTIMIFPEFHNMDVIHFYRDQYDPLSAFVRPHITLVFPFQSNMSNDRLDKHIKDKLMNIKSFELILHGVSKNDRTTRGINHNKRTQTVRINHGIVSQPIHLSYFFLLCHII